MPEFIKSLPNALNNASQLEEPGGHAAVSVVINPTPNDYQILMIERADNPKDPWSGQMGFPGGRHEECDPTIHQTATRETLEEVGLNLEKTGRFLGCLNDLKARNRNGVQNFKIAPHVFSVEGPFEFVCQAQEVKRTHWLPFSHLLDSQNHVEIRYPFASKSTNENIYLPSIEFNQKPIWGLSYMILTELFEKIYHAGLDEVIKSETPKSLDFWQRYPTG